MYLHDIDPILFRIGPVTVHWYGIMYLIGLAIAYWLGLRRLRAGRLPVTKTAYQDLIFYAMMGVILGGRIGYMLIYGWRDWIESPLAILKVWEGGMSFHGGLMGVIVAVALWSRAHKLSFWDSIDFVAPLVPPGLGLGRVGNFIGGELWGSFTQQPWGVIFAQGIPGMESAPMAKLRELHASGQLDQYARHPSQLYEALLEGVVMFALLWWFSSRPRPRYAVSGMFALLYGTFRFAIEFVREPDAHLGYLAFGWLTMGQILSLPLVLVGLALLWRSRSAPVLVPAPQPAAQPAAARAG